MALQPARIRSYGAGTEKMGSDTALTDPILCSGTLWHATDCELMEGQP